MKIRTERRLLRGAGLMVIGALLLGLPACGTRLPKEQLLADNAGGVRLEQAQQPGVVESTQQAVPVASADNPSVAPPGSDASAVTTVAGAKTTANAQTAPAKSPGPRALTNQTSTPPTSCTTRKSEVAVGTVGAQSGVVGAAVRAGVDAIKAWVADTNRRGGLACHPIRYYVADDGSDPARNAALTQQMIDEHHVLAMLFSNNPLSAQGSKPILERARVPTIGTLGGEEFVNGSPDYFPVAATYEKLIGANYGMLADQLTPDQKAHLGVLTCIEITFCSNFGGDLGNRIAKEFGLTVVYSSSATLVQPDYTSNCQRAKEAGVTAFFVVADGGMTSRTIRSCKKVGFDPQFASSPAAMSPSVSELPELENVLLGATVKPWTADDPNAQRYLATLAKYVPGGVPGGSGSIGWASALVLERAGQHLGDSPTPQDIYEGLWTFKNVDFNGFTAPLTYAKDKPASYPTCWWTMVIHDRKWMTPDNGKRSCRR